MGEIERILKEHGFTIDRENERIAEEALRQMRRSKLRGSEDVISELMQNGRIEYRGQLAESTEKLAYLMQIYRNPRFETFRIVYMRKDTILAISGIESRLPGVSRTSEDRPVQSYYKQYDRMKRLGADGYYLVHNHPSGNTIPSLYDMQVTSSFIYAIDGFRGHIILDHTRYGILDESSNFKGIYPVPQQWQVKVGNESIDGICPIGERITDVAAYIDHLNDMVDRSLIFYINAEGVVQEMEEVADKVILHNNEFRGYIRNESIENGSQNCCLVTQNPDVYDVAIELIDEDYVKEAIYSDGIGIERARKGAYENGMYMGLKRSSLPAYKNNSGRLPRKRTAGRLFLDMDGTLAEFKPVDTMENLYEEGYFAKLKPQENVLSGIKQFMSEQPEVEVYVLSSVLEDSPYARAEKQAWLDRYLPEIDAAHRIFPPCGQKKSDYVPTAFRSSDVLIDDYSKNLAEWCRLGKGIKLINNVNGKGKSWQGERIDMRQSPQEISDAIKEKMNIPTKRCEKERSI